MPSKRIPLPLAKEYKLERDVTINAERLINMYVQPATETTQGFSLYPASGFQNSFLVGAATIRAQFVFKDTMYVVSGNAIYSVDSLLVPTFLGNITTLNGYVGIDANETQVIFVDGANAYIWNTLTSVFSTVVFGFSPPIAPIDVTMIDNYFIIPDGNTIKFYVSSLNDGSTWNVLNFALFQSNPDELQAVNTLKRRIYLFGKYTTEVWYDAGDSDFPLRRDNNSLFEHGIASPGTVREGFEVMFYLAQNKDGAAGVMLVAGTDTPRKISSPEVDLYLQGVTNLSDSSAILYKENGYTFYQLSFTTDNRTFVYVLETDKWHELSLADGSRHPAQSHAFFNNKHYIGVYNANKIYELSYKFFTYGGDLIRCQIINPPLFNNEHTRIRADRYELEVITGMPSGTLPNQDIYPQLNELIVNNQEATVILYVSRDGGRTFGNGIRAGIGLLGNYRKRVIWRRLGCMWARRMVLKIEFPYLIPFIVVGSYIICEDLPE